MRAARGATRLAVWELSRALVTGVVALGLLYLLRPLSPLGPHLQDALALDELSRRSLVSLWLVAVVWALVPATVPEPAPMQRRRAANLAYGTAVILVGIAGTAVSLALVRQIGFAEALLAALRAPTVYVAALAAAGGNTVARALGAWGAGR